MVFTEIVHWNNSQQYGTALSDEKRNVTYCLTGSSRIEKLGVMRLVGVAVILLYFILTTDARPRVNNRLHRNLNHHASHHAVHSESDKRQVEQKPHYERQLEGTGEENADAERVETQGSALQVFPASTKAESGVNVEIVDETEQQQLHSETGEPIESTGKDVTDSQHASQQAEIMHPGQEDEAVEKGRGDITSETPGSHPTEMDSVPRPSRIHDSTKKSVLEGKAREVDPEQSDDEADMRKRAYEDMTNLYNTHDAASIPNPGLANLPGGMEGYPHPYVQGPQSSIMALENSRTCSPSLFKVRRGPTAGVSASFKWNALTANDVEHHILRTLPLTTFTQVSQASFHNVDGRVGHPVLGAMGGDAGEFLLALNAFEKAKGKPLSAEQVATLLSDYLVNTDRPAFAMQTDQSVLDLLCSSLKFCFNAGYRLDQPPAKMIPQLRELLILPEYVGCGHLRHMLEIEVVEGETESPFLVDKRLVRDFIKAFYNLLWGVPANLLAPHTLQYVQNKLRLQVMQGPHTEGALLHVRTFACSDDYIPMMLPESGDISVAVFHEDAVVLLRKQMAKFFATETKKLGLALPDVADDEVFLGKMARLADVQYSVALQLDKNRTPVFVLDFPGACCAGTTQPSGPM